MGVKDAESCCHMLYFVVKCDMIMSKGGMGMESTAFRRTLMGFDRREVTAYIEKSQREAAEAAQRMETAAEAARKSEEELRQALEERTLERDGLVERLADMARQNHDLSTQLEERTASEQALRQDTQSQQETIQALTEENRRLREHLEAQQKEMQALRQEKAQVIQLELDARQRAARVVARAQARAEAIRGEAQAQGEDILAQAQDQAQALYREMAGQVSGAARQCQELLGTCDAIAAQISGELRRMDVAFSQLPASFDHIWEDMDAPPEQTEGKA